jgi:hypothetical protein
LTKETQLRHQARVQAHPPQQLYTVALSDVDRKPLRFLLDGQGGEAGPYRMMLQRCWCTEHRHHAVAGKTADRAAKVLNHHCRTVDQLGHDLAQPLRARRRH